MKAIWKILPWFCLALFGIEIVAVMMPKGQGEFHTAEFGRLPVLLNGRIQPFDSIGRNALLQIRSTGDCPLELVPSWQFWRHGKKLKATEWVLEVMTRADVADTRPVFLIHHPDLLGELKLEGKGVEKSGLHYFSFNDLRPGLADIAEQGKKASEVKSEQRTDFQSQVIKLSNAVILYQRLKLNLQPEGAEDFTKEVAEFKANIGAAQAASQSANQSASSDRDAIQRVAKPLQEFQLMAEYGYALIVPPLDPRATPDAWANAGTSLLETVRAGQIHPAMDALAKIATAYRKADAAGFNQAVADYKTWLQPRLPKALTKCNAEYYFNQIKLFLHATIIYIFALLLGCVGLLAYGSAPIISEALRRSAFFLVLLAGAVHTFGLVYRMALEGRPPVTNLYSSAIFIGWGVMLAGILLERIYRVGIGNILAALVGFITLLIAHNLAVGGDTMEMMRAVLDNNFWLATHVVVITLGYSAAFAAGMVGVVYILVGIFTPLLQTKLNPAASSGATTPPTPKLATLGSVLSRCTYAIVCFGILFSFVGTVLGGIWADQSWGRFWGWDPKENGALLIVLWNAIILHARWGGMVRERGFMNLAVFGNIITSFSWFGVNMLGIGLHSYGFMDAGFKWLLIFMASQMAIIGLGLIPLHYWRSYRGIAPAPKSPEPGTGSQRPAHAST